MVAVPLAWASHQFTDVPDSNPFHGDISAITAAGVTAGKTCVPPGAPPTYCPTEGITREAMAAFVHRGFGRIASEQVDIISPIPTLSQALVSDADVTVGGVGGGQQLVFLQATFTAFATVSGPCNFGIRLWEGGVNSGTQLHQTFEQFPVAGAAQRTFTISDVVLAGAGVHQYELSMVHTCSTDVNVQDLNFIAATFAFGGNGTNVVIGSKGGASPPKSPGSSSTTPTG